MIETNFKKPKIVAEVGCNHMGKLEIAYDLIDHAKKAGVQHVKFQKRNNKELLSKEEFNAPHPVPYNSYGKTYGEHREFLEFNVEEHKKLKSYCEEKEVEYSSSVWDLTSAKEIISLDVNMIKVPSAMNNHFKLLEILRDDYGGEVHISFGMTNRKEEEEIINFFAKKNQNKRLVVYSCTSGYPVDFEDVCLLEIERIKREFASTVKEIGFSGHHNGIAVDVAAYVLGAVWIERHFTKNRTWKGTDHAASLEPHGLELLQRNLIATYKSLTYKSEEILNVEKIQRKKLKYKR